MTKDGIGKMLIILLTLLTAVFFVISPSIVTADVAVTGAISVEGHLISPPVTVERTNVNYTGTTFNWTLENGTMTSQYYNFTGILRVHVNWKVANGSLFLNILELVNKANFTGNLTIEISQYAKMGSSYFNCSTSHLLVYMDHNWQTSSNPGFILRDNNTTGPLPLYPSDHVSYYFGVNYTDPFTNNTCIQGQTNQNALGEYVVFNFHIKFN
ncbi:MAG: hypothetical protein ACYCPR_06190 [Thermoplasmataceae archaeon]|jgi:hypothetical protein|nr:hypothetical protein [Candidatus Thermoplasmatota archaeon]